MSGIIHYRSSIRHRRGIALLAVLFIIMAITVLSLSFLARSSTELACGENMATRMEMDQVASSGLEHARGLILQPQEVTGQAMDPNGYWSGGSRLQLTEGSGDCNYYDVTVKVPDQADRCTYSITCDAYREDKDGQKKGESKLSAQLRLDPAIALWTGANTTLTSRLNIRGDVYCGGTLTSYATVNGDAFSHSTITGTFTGQKNQSVTSPTVAWPFGADTAQTISSFTSQDIRSPLGSGTLSSSLGTSGTLGVFYRNGNLLINGSSVTVNGMLIVDGDLTIRSDAVKLLASKNLPALYVTGNLTIEAVSGFQISGLAAVDGDMRISGGATGASVSGALFVKNALWETTPDTSGNHCDGILHGVPTRSAGALQFDGADDYVQTLSTVTLWDDWTLSFWINADGTQNSSSTVLSVYGGGTTLFALQFASGQLVMTSPWVSPPMQTGISLASLTGAWHRVVVTMNGSHVWGWMQFACDSTPRNGDWVWAGGTGTMTIGTDRTAASESMYKGLLDDVRITGSTSARWRFDESGAGLTLEADPVKAAIVTWLTWPGGTPTNWSPAGGAFFKQVSR